MKNRKIIKINYKENFETIDIIKKIQNKEFTIFMHINLPQIIVTAIFIIGFIIKIENII